MAPRLGLLMQGGCQEPRAPRQAPACGASPAPPNLAPHKPGACRQEQKVVVAAQHSRSLLPPARCEACTAASSTLPGLHRLSLTAVMTQRVKQDPQPAPPWASVRC